MKKTFYILIASLFLANVVPAFAEGEGVYIYIAGGQSNSGCQSCGDNNLTNAGLYGFSSQISNGTTVYKIQAGYQFNQYVAIEGGYIDFGKVTYTAVGGNIGTIPLVLSLASNGENLGLVIMIPLQFISDKFSITALYDGLAVTESASASQGIYSISTSNSFTGSMLGVGVKYDFTPAASLRADYDGVNINGTTFNIWTVGVSYKFL